MARCTSCDFESKHLHVHRAVEFPSVTLCSTCIQQLFGWLYDQGVMQGNPFVAAFCYAPLDILVQSSRGYLRPSLANLGFKVCLKDSS